MNNIPKEFQKYFWDTDITKIDQEKHQTYIIERLLEHGDEKAVQWLVSQFPEQTVIQILKTTRSLSQKSANFWSLIYGVPKDQIRCLNKQLTTQPGRIWNL